MFPSNHADQCLLGEQSFSRNDPPTSSFFHFSPFLDHNTRFLSHENELLSGHLTKSPQMALAGDFLGANNAGMAVLGATQNSFSSKNSSPVAAGRKRSSNRERHSKIFTAQGLRDRRMRLSVDVARKFFGLQDMLGFDKASKTIGWLMMKSKAAIKELARGANSTSESEEISGVDETAAAADADQQEEEDLKEKSLEDNAKAKRVQGSKKATVCQAAKESRAIARAKARERTREKMSIRLEKSKQLPKGSSHGVQQLSPSIPLGSSAEDSSSRISPGRKSFELGVEINEPNKLGLSTYGYPHHILNAQGESGGDLASFNNNGMMTFFAENWDMGSSTRTRLSCCDAPNMHLFTPGF